MAHPMEEGVRVQGFAVRSYGDEVGLAGIVNTDPGRPTGWRRPVGPGQTHPPPPVPERPAGQGVGGVDEIC